MKLHYLETADGLELPALFFPGTSCGVRRGLGAVIVHGKGGNLLEKHLTETAQALAATGIPSLTFNNRGAAETGSAREFFDDCLIDIDTAINFLLTKSACAAILLLGHSYGGLKAAFYARHCQYKGLAGLVLMSSIPHLRLSSDLVELAKQLKNRGEAELIFSRKEGESICLYQPEAILKNHEQGYQGLTIDLLRSCTLPIFSFASDQEWEWFHEVTADISSALETNQSVTASLIKNIGDHCYSARESIVAETIVKWVLSVDALQI